MKKHLILLLVLSLGFSFGEAQLANYDFESWETVFSHEQPVSWDCNGVSFGACRKVEWSNSNFAVRMDNSLPCVDSADPSKGKDRSHGELTQFFGLPANKFTFSYDLVVDSIDEPAEFRIRLISALTGTVFSISHKDLVDKSFSHEIAVDADVDSLLIHIEPVGLEKDSAEHDCDLGYISVMMDNVMVSQLVNTSELNGKNNISIYPNPSSGWISVRSPQSVLKSILVYNSFGQVIESISEINDEQFDIHLAGVTGLVYIKAVDSTSRVETRRVMIN